MELLLRPWRKYFWLLIVCFQGSNLLAQALLSDSSHSLSPNSNLVVRQMLISGNKLTKDNIITRELSFKSGDTLSLDNLTSLLSNNRKRLLNLPLFTAVKMDTVNTADGKTDIAIDVKERWYLMPEISIKLADRNFNVWWYEQHRNWRRINIGCDIKHTNLFGNMEQLGVILQVGYTQRLGLMYAKPYIDAKQKHGVGANVIYSRSQELWYKTQDNKLAFARHDNVYLNRNIEANVFYTYRPAYSTRHLAQLSYRSYEVGDTVLQLNPTYFLKGSHQLAYGEASYRFDINRTDNWNYSLKGEKITGIITQRIGSQGMSYQTQLFLEATWMREFAKKWYSSFLARGRLSFPQNQPYPLVSALGYGNNYLRGYEYYVIDGSHFAMARAAIKRELWQHTFKNIPFRYLPELPIRLYPKVYADMGTVYNRFAPVGSLSNTFLRSVGVGIDLVTAYDIKLKFEYSFNHLGEHGAYFHQHGD